MINEHVPIVVEFTPQPGLRETSLSPADVAAKSAEALDNAMSAIYQMARRTQAVIKALPVPERPSEMEVDFALKLTTEAGVILAKIGAESTLKVKVKWKREGISHGQPA